MIRQNIILGEYTYIIDLYKADYSIIYNDDVDMKTTPIYKKFKLLKKYDIMSNVICDTDIYFIDSESYENIENVIFPIPKKTATGYSTDISNFNPDLNLDNLKYNTFNLYNSNLEETEILCDKVRIYLPAINPNKTCIIDIENYINDIRFHYLVKDLSKFETKTEDEIRIGNQEYCEYIDLYIPNIENLISNQNIYILDYNNIEGIENIKNVDDRIYVPFNTLYKKYAIKKKTKIYKIESDDKVVADYSQEFNYALNNTLNIIIYPYTGIDNSNIFILDSNKSYNSDIFTSNISFNLKLEERFPRQMDFETYDEYKDLYGIPCLFAMFEYPKLNKDMSVNDSYLYFNNVNKEFYDNFDTEEIFEELEEDESKFKTGFLIEISSDNKFKNIIYKYNISFDDEDIVVDDLIFPLDGIFDSWDNMPDILCARVKYIDRCINNIIISNPTIITKETYKYLIGDKTKDRISFTKIYFNDSYNETQERVLDMSEYINNNEIKIDGFNFIDKINCTVVEESRQNNISGEFNKPVSSKIIYKPIFYRVAELQNIKIKANVKQNIGVNLSDVMTKVEAFKMIIDNIEYVETGRNDVYVLFTVNSTLFNSTGGKYTIVNQDDEFVSDGNWYLY